MGHPRSSGQRLKIGASWSPTHTAIEHEKQVLRLASLAQERHGWGTLGLQARPTNGNDYLQVYGWRLCIWLKYVYLEVYGRLKMTTSR